jgi:hypothetical protein
MFDEHFPGVNFHGRWRSTAIRLLGQLGYEQPFPYALFLVL